MKKPFFIAFVCVLIQISAPNPARSFAAPGTATSYPAMFPLDQYLMADKDSEIALARSAAPPSIAQDADILVMTSHGYDTGAHGKNGFVCLVQRSWISGAEEPDFWNPRLRAPICLNPQAVRSYLPILVKRTELILSGRSKADMVAQVGALIDRQQIPAPETGAMSYMLSKQGYLGDRAGHWHPHLMFFVPATSPALWGADLPGSPIFASEDKENRLTIFMIPVPRWSDGSAEQSGGQ